MNVDRFYELDRPLADALSNIAARLDQLRQTGKASTDNADFCDALREHERYCRQRADLANSILLPRK